MECGFEGEAGIPSFEILEKSKKIAKWIRYENIIKADEKKVANQQVPQEGKLCDLWAEFKEHSKKCMAHHAIVKCGKGAATGFA